MIRKIRQIRDSEGVFAAVLKKFFKLFVCILRGLLLSKLRAYGFDKILSYILTWVDRSKDKVRCTFSKLLSVPEGSVSGPILFIISICDVFILNDHIGFRSYASDTTAFSFGGNFDQILDELEKHMTKISE